MAPLNGWKDGGRVDGKKISRQIRVFDNVSSCRARCWDIFRCEPYASYLWSSTKISPIAYMEQVTNHIETARLNSSVLSE